MQLNLEPIRLQYILEDRRHINDNDLKVISSNKKIPLNLEMAATTKMLKIALKYKPNYACLVPEKKEEITTEGGLNLFKNSKKIKYIINKLNQSNIRTSLFVNPSIKDIKMAKQLNSNCIEIHTGKLANLVKKKKNFTKEYVKIKNCVKYANSLKLEIHAGHGLDYKTTKILKKITNIKEYNIGHFIIGRIYTIWFKKSN